MPDQGSNQFVAARIDCALQERTIGPQALFADSRWFVFFLESGGATVLTQGENYEMAGPAVLWGPMDDDTRLKIGAGGVGSYLLLSDLILSDAIGRVTEAGELALFAQQPIMLSFGQSDRRGEELDRMFEQITGEARGGQFGAEIAIAAYVRLLLVLLWRSLDREALTRDTIGTHKSELMRFRNLVEAHFRARWKAQQYAHALGLTFVICVSLNDSFSRGLGDSLDDCLGREFGRNLDVNLGLNLEDWFDSGFGNNFVLAIIVRLLRKFRCTHRFFLQQSADRKRRFPCFSRLGHWLFWRGRVNRFGKVSNLAGR